MMDRPSAPGTVTSPSLTNAHRDDMDAAWASFTPPADLLRRYELREVLGRGSFGLVHRATRKHDGADVAIKFILLSDSVSAVVRFMREAGHQAKIIHPNVVRTLDASVEEGCGYLITEYCPGGTLRTKLDRTKRVPIPTAVRWIIDALHGLAACHAAGVVHRDLKPANLLLSAEGRMKIADLGIARATEEAVSLTRTGVVVGTPAYMSPEQVRGEAATHRSDVYSMGLILFELLGGRVGLDRRSPSGQPLQISESPITRSKSSDPSVPRPLVDVLDRALKADPADRYASAEAMAHDLEQYLRPPWERHLVFCAFRSKAAQLALGLVVAATVFLYVYTTRVPNELRCAEEFLSVEDQPQTVIGLCRGYLDDPRFEARARACTGKALLLLSRPRHAMEHLTRARALMEQDLMVRVHIAEMWLELGDRFKAQEEIRTVDRLQPALPPADALHGVCEFKSGLRERAKIHLDRAVRSQPADVPSGRILAQSLASAGRLSEATAVMASLTRRYPEWAGGYWWQGMFLASAGDPGAAMNCFSQGRARAGFIPIQPLLAYLKLLVSHGEPAQAERQFWLATSERDPHTDRGLVVQEFARFLRKQRRVSEAAQLELQHLETLESLGRSDAALGCARILRSLGRLTQSEAAFRRAMRSRSAEDRFSAKFELGQLLENRGETREARALFREALALPARFNREQTGLRLAVSHALDGEMDAAQDALDLVHGKGRVQWWWHVALMKAILEKSPEKAATYGLRFVPLGPRPVEFDQLLQVALTRQTTHPMVLPAPSAGAASAKRPKMNDPVPSRVPSAR
jgi:tetratricopeptide (TPR) repeat protein